MSSADLQTIVAQATAIGAGAIALIRLSGATAIAIADKMACLSSNKKLAAQASHTIWHGTIHLPDGQPLDSVLFFLMKAPKTFTGEDVVEISCHNNQAIVQEIIDTAIAHGARAAAPGEFTRRAVYNGKIDLLQAEAIAELISASNQQALRTSLAQLQGSFSYWIAQIENKLLHALALCQASFEFLDEEMDFAPQIKRILESIADQITQLQKSFDRHAHVRAGVRIALIGTVNAGKSSLFNALLGSSRAIVTNIPGTTRDCIEAQLYVQGNQWTLIDTAGLRSTCDLVEQEGIKRSHEQAQMSDIILLVYDASAILTAHEQLIYQQLYDTYKHKTMRLYNKCDISQAQDVAPDAFAISALTGMGLSELKEKLSTKIHDQFTHLDAPFLLNQRHFHALTQLQQQLDYLMKMLEKPAYELISIHITDTLTHLSHLTGKTISEQAMDAVFTQFCVGK